MKTAIGRMAAFGGLLLATAAAAPAGQTDSLWSLSDCVKKAFQTSSALEASRWTQQSARREFDESKSLLLPSVAAGASYSYTSETMHLDIETPPIPGYTAPHIDFGDGNVYDFNLNARIPIYAGGSQQKRAKAFESAALAAVFDFQSDSLRLLRDVRRAYFEVVTAQANLDAAKNKAARLRRHVEEIEGARKIGTVTEETRLFALANLRAAEGEELRQAALATAARLRLGNLIGIPETEIRTYGDLDASLITEHPSGMTRPELSALDYRIAQNKHAAKAAKGSYLPSLSGIAAYHYARPGINQVQNDWMDYYTIGLTASWTLWDFGARSYRVQALRMTGNAITSTREDIDRSFRTMLAAASSACESARPAADKMQERLSLQRERIKLVEERLKTGLATESEYLDAQDDLTEAEFQWIASVAALRMAEVDLLYALGR